MLTIDLPERDIPGAEFFDNRTQTFITIQARHIPAIHLQLEHSLMSIAKWESKWHESFMGKDPLSGEEFLDYIRCMTVNPQKDPDVYQYLTEDAVNQIVEYMNNPYSAWEIRNSSKDQKKKKRRRHETVESIYYAMIQYGIPESYERWHFNRLQALIDYCSEQGGSTSGAGGPRKKTEREIMEMYRAMNEKNRKKFKSKG